MRTSIIVFLSVFLTTNLALAEDLPELDREAQGACTTRPDGTEVKLQCDEAAKRCLVAPVEVTIDDERAPNTRVMARGMAFCNPAAAGAWERLVADGYEMVPAVLSAPYGYKRDERNRLYQTHFSLRDRFFLGVGDMLGTTLAFDESLTQGVRLEMGASVESFDRYDVRRHRFRFLEGSVLVAPLEIEGLLFAYDKGRISNHPDFWITTFIGEPRRFDINLDIGPGFHFGRLWLGDVEDVQNAFIDLGQVHLNWELLQSATLEDYLYVRAGGGVGLRAIEGRADVEVYLYPEAAIGGALRLGDRGLWEFGTEVRFRYGAEFDSGEDWLELRGSASVERILVAINDQPISLFVEPSVHILDLEASERAAFQTLLGVRMSFFVPPPRELK